MRRELLTGMLSTMSLKYRIAATVFVLEAVMLFLVLWLTLSASLAASRAQLAENEENVLTLLSGLGLSALITEEYADVQPYLERVAQNAHVLHALLEHGGRVVASSVPSDIGKPRPALADQPESYWRTRSILSPGGEAGKLHVQFSTSALAAAHQKALTLGVSIALTGMSLVAAAGILMGFVLTRRLEVVASAAQRIAGGDFSVGAHPGGHDEVPKLGQAIDRMAQEVERHLSALQASEQRFSLVVQATREGIWDWNLANGEVLFFNRFKEMLGYREEEIPDRYSAWMDLLHEQDRERVNGAIRAHLDHGAPFNIEIRMRNRGGDYQWILCQGQAVRDASGTPVRIVGSCIDIHERKCAQQSLEQLSRQLRLILDSVGDGIYGVDSAGDTTLVNPAALRMLGYPAQELLGRHTHEIMHHTRPDGSHYPASECPAYASFRDGRVHRVTDEVFWRKDGTPVPVDYVSTPIREDGRLVGAVVAFRDITERKQAEEALFQEKERAQVTLESIGEGVITTDIRGFVDYVNPVAEQMTGWTVHEVRGRPLLEVFNVVHEHTREPAADPVAIALREGRSVGSADSMVLIRSDGEEFYIVNTTAPIRDRKGGVMGAVLVFHDISKTRKMEQQLSYQATHDALTALFNRREFERRLAQALLTSRTQGLQHALCYLDLDQFKIVNDTCGHSAGDELLRQIAGLLQDQVRKTDMLARLGGDEFGVLLEDCPLEQALRIGDKLRQAVKEFRFVREDKTFAIGVSIGLVPIAGQEGDIARVLGAADESCYMAKEKGRNRIHVYEPDDKELTRRHGEMQWVTRIHQAFDEGQLVLYYQPIVPLQGNDPAGGHHEILVRIRDRDGRLVPPMAFIPAAERYDLMPAIDRWVVRHALAAYGCKLREETGFCLNTCAINLSGISLGDEDFLGFVQEQLARYEIPAHTISFEITETAPSPI